MRDPGPPFAKPLLQEAVPQRGFCNGKTVILVPLFISACFTVLALQMQQDVEQHQVFQEHATSMLSLPFSSGTRQQLLPLRGTQQALPFAGRQQRRKGSGGDVQQSHAIGGHGKNNGVSQMTDFSFTQGQPLPGHSTIIVRASETPSDPKNAVPQGEMVLIKLEAAETQTKGGIFIPDVAQKKTTAGEVVAVGSGETYEGKKTMELKPGNFVVYSGFGTAATNVKLQDEDYILIRERDVLGLMPGKNFDADMVPELQPVGDHVLCKVIEAPDETVGGVLLTDDVKEKPVEAIVVRSGPGLEEPEKPGEYKPCPVNEGDKIVFNKFAGDNLSTRDGTKYIVLTISEILAKVG
eukprot:gnl/MRDRNA2_/MRDRNA2_110720_c0_seq1.p1 gnl/MRDRNA2_/MRDRNA2_110720_c0~~gnl/MRDRNA2_/MRDRNA2_110720_c0_seq1.p1  ORF type:complete len:351 (-),score=71.63 gnl/MRDRNA2_/MRDRNA2_110720_c0_seq1:210-1262(-)